MSTVASQSHQTSAYMQPAAGVHVGLDSHPSGTLKSRCAPLREHGETSEPQQEIMGTLPPEFRLSNTKAEVKGGVHQPIYAHDIDIPPNKPHLAPQSNKTTKPPHKNFATV